MDMRGGAVVVTINLLFFFLVITNLAAADSISDCQGLIQKMTSCLDYVTAKATDPSSDCCSTVKLMKDNNVICLCKFIQQIKNGGNEVKQLGIQEAKLNTLPIACNMKNTNTSQCSLLLPSQPPGSAASVTNLPSKDSSSCTALRLDIIALFALVCLAILL